MTWFRLTYNRREFQNMSLRRKVMTKRWLARATEVLARHPALDEQAVMRAAQELLVFGNVVSVKVAAA